jgi:hypothetical protein
MQNNTEKQRNRKKFNVNDILFYVWLWKEETATDGSIISSEDVRWNQCKDKPKGLLFEESCNVVRERQFYGGEWKKWQLQVVVYTVRVTVVLVTELFINTAVKTSNLKQWILVFKIITFGSLGVFIAVKIQTGIFLVTTLCNLVGGYQRFEGTYSICLQGWMWNVST